MHFSVICSNNIFTQLKTEVANVAHDKNKVGFLRVKKGKRLICILIKNKSIVAFFIKTEKAIKYASPSQFVDLAVNPD